LASSVIMLMKSHADQKNINLLLEYEDSLDHYFYGDPTRLRQILLNLIGNALKFTTTGRVKLIIRADESRAIYFAIEDTGIGISDEAQAKLFQPFSQADSTISRKYGGTGLGLTICKKLIEVFERRETKIKLCVIASGTGKVNPFFKMFLIFINNRVGLRRNSGDPALTS